MERDEMMAMVEQISEMKMDMLKVQRDRAKWKKAAEVWLALDKAEKAAVEMMRGMDVEMMNEREVWCE